MKKAIVTCLLTLFIGIAAHAFEKKPVKILVFSKTKGFRHNSIETGKQVFLKLGKEHHFEVDTTENADYFTGKKLNAYAAVVFLNTTGDILNAEQQNAFEKYIRNGGGYVGIHAATDTEYDWPWYGKLAGAYFLSHPAVQEAHFTIADRNHPATSFLTDSTWIRKDELYNFKDIQPDLKVLIFLDEKSYTGGKNGDSHPFSWYHNFDGGRAFYTGMGHTKEGWADEKFQRHIWGGLQYATGLKKVN